MRLNLIVLMVWMGLAAGCAQSPGTATSVSDGGSWKSDAQSNRLQHRGPLRGGK